MAMQVAQVSKPLGSVYQFCKAGNRVVFDEGNSYIQNKETGLKTKIHEENGVYNMHLWVPKGVHKTGGIKIETGMFGALITDEESDFQGRDDFKM